MQFSPLIHTKLKSHVRQWAEKETKKEILDKLWIFNSVIFNYDENQKENFNEIILNL